MLRFIIKKKSGSWDSCAREDLITIDADVPILEQQLRRRIENQYDYEMYELYGVEVCDDKKDRGL